MNTPQAEMEVTFVGAGPGAEDLITVRGLRALEQADVVVYAGSLVNPDILKHCQPSCTIHDSANMSLQQQVAVMLAAVQAGQRVVRLHTGDPALYGAINEQIHGLADAGVGVRIVPGVSSVFGAAAALGCELTSPEVSQSVVLTRTPGRTPMPEGENAVAFAKTGATLVFFLSTGNIAALMHSLMHEGELSPDTPAAVVYRATWPDERIVRGTVGDIAEQVEAAGLGRQALIFVGQALAMHRNVSRLYDTAFSHGYRNSLSAESFQGRCAVYAFTSKGLARAREIASGLGETTVVHAIQPGGDVQLARATFDATLAENWACFDAHIFVSATGIAVRKIAPLLRDKSTDPAVITCSETGAHVISLTSGHLGGANRLARRVARITGGQAVVSTATDLNGLPAFDDVVAHEQARVLNPAAICALNAALLAGEHISFCGSEAVFTRYFSGCEQLVHTVPAAVSTAHAVLWDTDPAALPVGVTHLDISSKAFVLGIGCRRDTDIDELEQCIGCFLRDHGVRREQLAALASCDLKADEPALVQLAAMWQVPIHFHPCKDLGTIPTPTPSEVVRERIGIPSVCEAAALASAQQGGKQGKLLCPKTTFTRVTLALACLPHGEGCSKQGQLVVVGLGSGAAKHITPEVEQALRQCDTVAGYSAYVDFIRDRIHGKRLIQNGMMGEVARCREALRAASSGENVCMVCSGDPGILAMAGLLYELRAREDEFAGIPIKVLPGITSANIAAATLGAPLQNGFSLVSLSDLLVPADEVRTNLHAVAQSALPVTLYNPAGRKRRALLGEALAIFAAQRGNDTFAALVRHAGRPQQYTWVGRLGEFPADEVDMSTLVLIGSPRTVFDGEVLYEARGYVDKYLKDNA